MSKVTTRSYVTISDGKGAATQGTVKISEKSTIQGQTRDFPIVVCMAGTTAQRPAAGDSDMPAGGAPSAHLFLDTSLGYIIVSNGQGGWHNPATGAKV
jgi:hypothetical protein